MTGSAGQLRVSKTYFEEIKIPLPPFLEQNRIVAKIEELFSELDAGIESLKTARSQLKIYRQSVLKWAFEGKLTAEWRQEQQRLGKLQSAYELLEQIKIDRENHYQQQLKNWEAAVKTRESGDKVDKKPTKPSKPKKITFLSVSEIAILPSLPKRWNWIKLHEISEVSGGLTKNSKRDNFEIKLPYLRVANVYSNKLSLKEVLEIGIKQEEIERVLLRDNDLLVVEGNGSIDHIGRVAIWDGSINPCVHQNHIIKVRMNRYIIVKAVLYFLLSHQGREFIKKEAASTSGLYTLSLSKVENLKIPIASVNEQHQIVQEIESRLSICDNLENTIEENLQRAESLRQSILKQAFTGKLVPQDPNDEPAAQLLARIQQEQSTQQTPPLKPRKPAKKTP